MMQATPVMQVTPSYGTCKLPVFLPVNKNYQ